MIIYPAIDLRGGQCVRLVQGDYSRETVFAANPIQPALDWVQQGADRLHLVDLDGAKAGRPINGDVIQKIIQEAQVPCQLGGGIRTEADLETVFGWGVRWAVLGTKALQDPAWVREMAVKFPGQIVLGVDARNGFVATDGWLNTSTTTAIELTKLVEDAPLFAVVYTDISRDGMMQGPNFESLAQMRSATRLPVVASGGVSTLEQAEELARQGTFAAIIGRALYEGAIRLPDLLALGKVKG
jgi:phosphoribosylformimino-5-aminoimidazole carboxamide ribotide isomerase